MQPTTFATKNIAKFKLIRLGSIALTISSMFATMAVSACQPASASNQPQQTDDTPVKQAPQEGQWRVIAPSDAMATFQMPKKPRYIERTFTPVANKPPIKVHLHLATVKDGKATYIFGYHDLHETPSDRKAENRALEGAVRGSVVNVQGKLLSEVTKIRFKRSPGRQFNYRYFQGEKPYVVLSRVFLVGKRQYQISALALESEFNETTASEFLNSFKLVTVIDDAPPVPRFKK